MKLLEIRTFLSFLGASVTGLVLYFRFPFPEMNLFLNLIKVRELPTFLFLKYSYVSLLFTTPFFAYSLVTSFLYMFFYNATRKKTPSYGLPPYPDPCTRESLYLVIGEVHNPRKALPAENPYWLTIPDRGLFTGIAMLGAIGSGKTSGSMYPFVYQLLAFKCGDGSKRIGGLVLEVKGDFCYKVRTMLKELSRERDYIDISLESDYCYNPLHNDLDAYALAYGVASLLTNLFGRGKEPFWQQAYTNLVKFIILLHKVLFDYVTLFDVYECAINRQLLEAKIQQGEKLFEVRSYYLVEPEVLRKPEELGHYDPTYDRSLKQYRLVASPDLQKLLNERQIPYTGPCTET